MRLLSLFLFLFFFAPEDGSLKKKQKKIGGKVLEAERNFYTDEPFLLRNDVLLNHSTVRLSLSIIKRTFFED